MSNQFNFRAELINEATLKVEKVAYGATRQEALERVGFFVDMAGYDANVSPYTPRPAPTGLSGCGVHSFYVD